MNDHMAIQDIPGMSEQKSEIVENNSMEITCNCT